jgi:hypothetical protein
MKSEKELRELFEKLSRPCSLEYGQEAALTGFICAMDWVMDGTLLNEETPEDIERTMAVLLQNIENNLIEEKENE